MWNVHKLAIQTRHPAYVCLRFEPQLRYLMLGALVLEECV
jgi:hypothetical protein